MQEDISLRKIADYFKLSKFDKADYESYVRKMEELYPQVKNPHHFGVPMPEVVTRLAEIRSVQGRKDEAIALYEEARRFLEQRLKFNDSAADRALMFDLINDYYSLVDFDEDYFGLYDLFYLLQRQVKVRFHFIGKDYVIESRPGEILLEGESYKGPEDFFERATVEGCRLGRIYDEAYLFKTV